MNRSSEIEQNYLNTTIELNRSQDDSASQVLYSSFFNFCPADFSYIDNTIESKLNWKSGCLYEIPANWLYRAIMMVYPSLRFDSYTTISAEYIWRDIYLSYTCWQSLIKRQLTIERIINYDKFSLKNVNVFVYNYNNKQRRTRITCTAVFKKYLAVGTENGSIIIYDLKVSSRKICVFNHGERILKLIFWPSADDDVNIVSICQFHEIKYWDLIGRAELPHETNKYVTNLCTDTMNNLFIEISGNVIKCIRNVNHIKSEFSIQLPLNDNEMVDSMFQEKGKMLFLCRRAVHSRLFHLNILHHDKSFEITNITLYTGLPISTMDTEFGSIYFPTKSLGIGLFDNCLCFFMTDKNKWFRRDLNIYNNVTSVIMHANVLILGLKSGEVKIISLGDDTNFNYYVEKYPFKKIKVANQPIVSLSLTEINGIPRIIACTEKKVYIIS